MIVIGAGQAGLAMGYYLRQTKLSYVILGKEERVGDVWRNRYDSLILFTPRWFSALPGMTMKGDPDGFAGKLEVADYLAEYAVQYHLPVRLETEVKSLYKQGGEFIVITSRGEYSAKHVVVASGPFQKPWIPHFASELSESVFQVHSSRYRNHSQLEEGPVVIVGGGNSGAQIAEELAGDREVYLSTNRQMRYMPLKVWGKSIFWWLDKLGIYRVGIHTKLGKRIRKRGDPIVGNGLASLVRSGQVKLKPSTVNAESDRLLFDNGTRIEVQNVIWATGFSPDYYWIHIPDVLDSQGKPVHLRGVGPVEGLYFLGMPWQHSRSSALIAGVAYDAEYINRMIVSRQGG